MTQDPVPPSPRRPAWDAAAELTTAAEQATKDRIFLLTRPRGTWSVPQYLDPTITGFSLCGREGEQRIGEISGRHRLPVVADLAYYESRMASPETPMLFPETLFGRDGFFDDMRARSHSAVFTPTAYVEAGEPAALKAVRAAAQEVTRTDVVVVVPLDVTWLRDSKIDQLIAILKAVPHPIALVLGGQYNPTDSYADIMRNLRRVYQEIGRVGPWRTDPVTALDAMAQGGMFAGVGSSGSLRHLVPPGQATKITARFKPSVFIPELLHFFRADTLTERWANVDPLSCWCAVCEGRGLDRFDSYDTSVDTEARAHNAASWCALWAQMHALPTGVERQRWLAERIRLAHLAYEAENGRIQQANAFKPSKTLQRLAKLSEGSPSRIIEGARTPAP
ncbi:hypothetical protein M8C17_21085 [Micromonospora sp. RHAY321]|uniref:hypothetical protein n=1 Tax=Micromonospora sp. RHAY321 TaxID=2944807 RepID=UPI00207C3FA3|nr:hypothetical protein [Micromonospora sp. RHAY321]MCO1597650.1 hypothetical protein [Micromonospora sp. RHAY321]